MRRLEPPQPQVKSTGGTEQSASLATLPGSPLIDLELAEVPLGALGSIVFHRQATSDGPFTVQGTAIDLADQAAVVLASASCGKSTSTAPPPSPVTTNLPVLG